MPIMLFATKHATLIFIVLATLFFTSTAKPINASARQVFTFRATDDIDTEASTGIRHESAVRVELSNSSFRGRGEDGTDMVLTEGLPLAKARDVEQIDMKRHILAREVEDIDTDGPMLGRSVDTDGSLSARQQFSSPSTLYNQLFNLRSWPEFDGPYCATTTNLNTCYFASRVSADQSTAEIWAYDHNCVEIGHNPSIPVPITLKDALTTQKFPFDSQLPNVIVVQFTQNYAPASIAYAGQVYGWGATTSFCNNAGPSNLSPGFRLSCYVPFSC